MTIGGATRVFGIFGDPVAHSRSPQMQNAALAAAGLDAVYVPFHVRPPELAAAVAAVRALGLAGVNVTVPHKEAICPYLDRIDPEAELIGAVNTVVHRDGILTGYNTDAAGFLRALAEDLAFVPAGRRILLLGAGGAGRAAAAALARGGAAWIGIANRTPERGEALAAQIGAKLPGTSFATLPLCPRELAAVLPRVDLVVNSSSVGLRGEVFDWFPWENLNLSAAVYDMVYRPGGTPLVRDAAARGHRAVDGLGMLAAQGEEAFFLWTGRRPSSGLMRSVLAESVAK